MLDILESIKVAEQQATEIKEQARKKANEISENAETRAAEILALNEAECKALREKGLKDAEAASLKNYNEEITQKRAQASKYASDRLKNCEDLAAEIVRRVVRGGR